MFELVLIDMETGEDELVCTGTMRELIEHRDEALEEADDNGYDFGSWLIQPAS